MKITKLEVRKHASYEDYPNQIAGTVTLEGDDGKQEVRLSPLVVSQIFSVIAKDLVERSRNLADQTKAAIEEAVHAPLLEDKSVIDL